MREFIFDLQRFVITNYTNNTLISGTSGNDTVKNSGDKVTIIGGAGDDSIYSYGDSGVNVSISGGTGNDTIENWINGEKATLIAGAGNDYIFNIADNVTVDAGAGNDTVTFIFNNKTYAKNNLIRYAEGDGNDLIKGFNADDTLSISGGSYSTATSGSDVIVTVGDGKITLQGAASLSSSLHIAFKQTGVTLKSSDSYTSLIGGNGNDSLYIDNYGVTASGGAGNDTIYHGFGDRVSINGGAGNDLISLCSDRAIWYQTIKGGTGNDTIYADSGGTSAGYGSTYEYSSGDGNDIIYNFNEHDTLSIGGGNGTYTRETRGSNVIVTVGDGKISLIGAASLGSSLNIVGTEIVEPEITGIIISDSSTSLGVSLSGITIDILGTNDTLENLGKNVTIIGSKGNDYIYNNNGDNSSINTGDGNDSVNAYDNDYVTINTGAGNDTVTGRYYGSKIYGGDGNDKLIGNYWWDSSVVDGGNGSDTIVVQSGSVNGGAGNDSINVYNDNGYLITVKGGTGDDTIVGSTTSTVGTLYQYSSGDGYDTIYNWKENDTLNFGSLNYTRSTLGSNVLLSIQGGGAVTLSGASSKTVNIVGGTLIPGIIENTLPSVKVNGTSSADTIKNTGHHVSIYGGAGADSIVNTNRDLALTLAGSYSYIDAGAGNDFIDNYYWADFSFVSGGNGNDTVLNRAAGSTVYGGNGNDSISNITSNVSMNGGAGNDYISNTNNYYNSNLVTIEGGVGNDTVDASGRNSLIRYKSGDGNDSIIGFNSTSSLQIGGGKGTYSSQVSGKDVIVTVGEGKITLVGASSLGSNLKIYGEYKNPLLVTLTSGADNYTNTVEGATIQALSGNDTLYNTLSSVKIDGGKGNDSIENDGSNVTILGGAGNDSIWNDVKVGNGGSKVTIDGGAGNDYIRNYDEGNQVSINGGAGNDTIANGSSTYTGGKKVTIIGGKGNDSIVNFAGKNTLFKYSAGDGNDVIEGFNTTSSLQIGNGTTDTYSIEKNGDNVIVTVGDGSILLKSAANLSKVNIKGKEIVSNTWTISGTTAKYGTSSKTLVTVKGVKSLDGLSLKNKVVTVSKASLGTSNITISNGYTLKLGSDVPVPTTKKAAFSLSGSTATYNSSYKTAGYKLASNSKSISYSEATKAKSLATIQGASSTNGLSVKNNVITLKNSSLKSKVTVSGSYEFDFASDYKKATISGSKNSDTITARGSKISINGGAGDDTIKILGTNTTVTGGDGSDIFVLSKDKSNVIADYAAEDKISITSGTAKIATSGNDVIFTVGSGKITVTGGKDKTITYSDSGGKKTYTAENSSAGVKYNKAKTSATLLASYRADAFSFSEGLQTLTASKVTHDLMILGNKEANSIVGSSQDDTIDGGAGKDTIRGGNGNDSLFGGKGNDELYGGEGSDTLWGGIGDDYLEGGEGYDIFVYSEGNDKIFGYEQGLDKIMILSNEQPLLEGTPLKNDVTFNVGKGKITVLNAAHTVINFIDSNGKDLKPYVPSK